MSGYHQPPSGYYGYSGPPPPGQQPQQPYGGTPSPAYNQPPYGSASNQPPYGGASNQSPYGGGSYGGGGGASAPPAPYASSPPYGEKPPKENKPHGGYGEPPQPYGGAPSSHQPSYGGASYGGGPYGEKPPKENKPQPYGGAPSSHGGSYGSGASAPSAPYGASPYGSYGSSGGYPPSPQAYGSPFASLVPSQFPPGTDPNIIASFQIADEDRSGLIDDKELQGALSSYNQSFSLRTVHLLMYTFTNSNVRKIGPKEFTALYYGLQNWRGVFDRFDRDRSGKIDKNELRDALLSLGYAVSPVVLDLLVTKFDKTGGRYNAIEYDNFIECCLTVKGLTEKFKEKDVSYAGSATFTYDAFMLTVLPFLIA
ncbi:hypothetical protein ACFE04_029341 [Oxalis oulophora]